jgi:hypothetical protein
MITKGSSSEFETKQQKKDHYQRVNHVASLGPSFKQRGPTRHFPLMQGMCWGEGEDATLRAKPSSPRYTNEGEMIDTVALCLLHCKKKARLRRSLLIPRVHLAQRPTWNSTQCNGPCVDKRVTGLICNSFSVMTVCNLPLWQYSGDNQGTRRHKRPCLGTLAARKPINIPVKCP